MATIQERYRCAVHASDLKSEERTFRSNSDVLGAMGLADRHLTEGYVVTGKNGEGYRIPKSPLSVPLERLLAGDSNAVYEVVSQMAAMVWRKADKDRVKPKISRSEAKDVAKAVVAWYRNGTCKACGGHGFSVIIGAPALSERQCEPCGGSGKVALMSQFHQSHQDAVRWLLSEMDRALGRAGPQAMVALSDRMRL